MILFFQRYCKKIPREAKREELVGEKKNNSSSDVKLFRSEPFSLQEKGALRPQSRLITQKRKMFSRPRLIPIPALPEILMASAVRRSEPVSRTGRRPGGGYFRV